MSKAIFPGTFDPVTLGHEGLVRRALKIFDAIVIGIGANSEKKTLFSQEQRLAMLKATFADSKNISIEIFEGLTVDFAKKMGATTIIRGIRNGIDLEYEKPISAINHELNPDIETVFIVPDGSTSHISSSLVREVIKYKGRLDTLIPAAAIRLIQA